MLKKKVLIPFCIIAVFAIAGFSIGNWGDKTTAVDYINNGGPTNTVSDGNPNWTGETDAAPVWTSGTNMPAPTRYHGGGVTYTRNDTSWLYCFGGDADGSGGVSNVVSIYNITTNTWSTGPVMPATVVMYTTAGRVGNIAYIVGGIGAGGLFTSEINEIKRYNLATNTWMSNAANYPVTVADAKTCGYQDSVLYVVGGIANGTSSGTNQVNIYNVNTNTWRPCTPLPGPKSGGGMTISGDTIIYVAGGPAYGSGSNVVYRGVISQSDRSVIVWTTGANFPGANNHRLDAAPWGCQGIVVSPGSPSGFGTSNQVYRYTGNTWTALPNSPTLTSAAFVGSSARTGNIYKLVVASGLILSAPFSIPQVQILTDTLCPVTTAPTLVMYHDTTVFNQGRKDDRDTLFKYLPAIAGAYDRLHYTGATVFPNLAPYSTIIIQETANDGVANFMTSGQRTALINWLNSGTSGNRKRLIMIGADLGYNYSRSGAPQRDTVLSQQMAGFVFRSDNASNTAPNSITGTNIDIGGVRAMTTTPTGGWGFWPDGNAVNTGAVHLYRHTPRGTTDSLAAIGKITAGYTVASTFQDPRYFLGGFGNVMQALWNFSLSTVAISNNGGNVPNEYSLGQNYPNPFNPTTNIKFSVPNNGLVKIVIFDILGRQVGTLLNEVKTAGNYTVDFDASNLSSGAYFYRLEAGNFTETKKMLLVK
jgi:hypothetical protein